MTAAFTYSALALAIIVVVALLVHSSHAGPEVYHDEVEQEYLHGLWEGRGLSLAERILDPSDYLWLRDELGFPALAESLRRSRQHLTLKWLKAVRRSFSEMVRTPEPVSHARTADGTQASWQLLRLTLRFHLLLSYAFLVVRFFGPYHRLIPSLGWMHLPWSPQPHREPFPAGDGKHFH
jgi:hypothetical protein